LDDGRPRCAIVAGVWPLEGNSYPQVATPPGHDREIAQIAAEQHGIVTRRQLIGLGVSADEIAYRRRIGRLHLLYRGVYAVGHRPPSPHARAIAAVFACGPTAVLSHRSAAALWGIGRWRRDIDVTARGNHARRGVTLHRSRTLEPQDVTHHHGIPVTTPARTLLDLADVLDDAALTRAVNEARLQRQLSLPDLAALLIRSPGRATTRLRPHVEHATQPTRSHFEDAFLVFAERYGLPRPEVNQQIAGYEVDMLWRDQRVIVELDGWAYHDERTRFEHDRDKDAALLAAGFPVVRITWRRFTETPGREARRLHAMLQPTGARRRAVGT
jgi:very-short-patch-repair endonuclease